MPVAGPAGRHVWLASAILVAAGVLAYCNSFRGPFIADDVQSISDNPHIRRLWPIDQAMTAPAQSTVAGRPVVCLSLALNYRISGLDVWSYHAFNLAGHILAGLALFGIVRRTLLLEPLAGRFGRRSTVLALACAAIWLVHPLQTESVTYVVQRTESLMGLLYLLTLYCAIRGFASPRGRRWFVAAVVSCALGMGTKEVMATAPILVLLYDRVFVARSFSLLLRRRWGLYAGLSATWLILLALVVSGPRSETAGFGFPGLSALDYARAQCNVIVLDYLKLAFWPHPLVFDCGWPMAGGLADYAPAGAVLLVLLGATGAALRYRPHWGFLGAWFFLILAPTSSFLPIVTEIAAERRMYLPLAAVVVAGVMSATVLGRWLLDRPALRAGGWRRAGWLLGTVLAAVVVVILGGRTLRRNRDYRSHLAIWTDTVGKRPDNYRAHNNLGHLLLQDGQAVRAREHFSRALEVKPAFSHKLVNPAFIYHNRGKAHWALEQYEAAMRDYDKAVELDPKYFDYYNSRGVAYLARGQVEQALEDLDRAVALLPTGAAAAQGLPAGRKFAGVHFNRGLAHARRRQHRLAVQDFDRAILLDGRFSPAYYQRGLTHTLEERYDRALADFDRAIDCNPAFAEAYSQRGIVRAQQRDYEGAVRDCGRAVSLRPDSSMVHRNMAFALASQGEAEPAIRHLRRALQLRGDWPLALNDLAWLLATHEDGRYRDGKEAVRLAEHACKLTGHEVYSLVDTLAAAYAEAGRFDRAVETAERALAAASAAGDTDIAAAISRHLASYKANKPHRQ